MFNVNAKTLMIINLSMSMRREHCPAKIGWRMPGGHMAGCTHRKKSVISH